MAASEVSSANKKTGESIATDDSKMVLAGRDPLYLFACHLLWHRDKDIAAYQELIAALDDCNLDIRALAEDLLHRSSPRPGTKRKMVGDEWM